MEESDDYGDDLSPSENGGNGHGEAIRALRESVRDIKTEIRQQRAWLEQSRRYWWLAGIVLSALLALAVISARWAIPAYLDQLFSERDSHTALSVSLPWPRRIEELRRAIRGLPTDAAYWTTQGAPRVDALERLLPMLGRIYPEERDLAWMLEQRGVP